MLDEQRDRCRPVAHPVHRYTAEQRMAGAPGQRHRVGVVIEKALALAGTQGFHGVFGDSTGIHLEHLVAYCAHGRRAGRKKSMRGKNVRQRPAAAAATRAGPLYLQGLAPAAPFFPHCLRSHPPCARNSAPSSSACCCPPAASPCPRSPPQPSRAERPVTRPGWNWRPAAPWWSISTTTRCCSPATRTRWCRSPRSAS
ncbi:hypothetical protein D3C78_1238140 [compost metagenome]